MSNLIVKYFLVLFLLNSKSSFSQSESTEKKGNYFTTTNDKYKHEVIEPWRFDFQEKVNLNYSNKAIGKLTFWRSEALTDTKTGRNWKPNISYDIFLLKDAPNLKEIADSVKLISKCDSINVGGDIIIWGQFALINSSSCVDCASGSGIDYCRNFVKRFIKAVIDVDNENFSSLLKQLNIRNQKFINK